MEIILGQRLKELREEKGWTQKQVAAYFHISAITYLHYEKQQREPPLSLLADFAAFFRRLHRLFIGIGKLKGN